MNDKTGAYLRNSLLGLGLAVAILFVVASIALLTDLFFDLRYADLAARHPDPSDKEADVLNIQATLLGARATLIGNMIGAVVSGMLAIFAAFGAVYLESAERRAAKLARRKEIGAALQDWIGHKAERARSIVIDTSDWLRDPDRTATMPLFIGHEMNRIARIKLNKKMRATAENEYLHLAEIFASIDKLDRFIEANAGQLLERAHGQMFEAGDKRAGIRALLELFDKMKSWAALLRSVGFIVDNTTIQKKTDEVNELIFQLVTLMLEASRALNAEIRKARAQEKETNNGDGVGH